MNDYVSIERKQMKITIELSCGETFVMKPSEMSVRQLWP